jgi:SAM-dependent methyltransferase
MAHGLETRVKRFAASAADRLYGIDSQTQVSMEELGYADGSGYLHYQASGWLSVPGVFSGWPPRPGAGDVFVDLGCGKGRPLVQVARRYPVDRVVGVERDAGLAEVARENLRRTQKHHRARGFEVHVGDARTFEIPDDATIVYVANPFGGDVFEEALQRVLDSYDRRPRPMRFAYVGPREEARLTSTGRFRRVEDPHARWIRAARIDPSELRRYEIVPGRPPAPSR